MSTEEEGLSLRGSGRTWRAMREAPQGAVYVWCSHVLGYAKFSAEQLNRQDLEIVGPEWLAHKRYVGRRLTGVVFDHALKGFWDERQEAQDHVRVL